MIEVLSRTMTIEDAPVAPATNHQPGLIRNFQNAAGHAHGSDHDRQYINARFEVSVSRVVFKTGELL
ncbi:MAG: hypothetical protein HPY46_05815 [Candidatus Aminicenantes bacterium]|nr:hypothetical protein [Candidatus Aminicenantes bacterium]